MLELNKVYHGDCLNLLPQIQDHSIDTVITDLPYGISYQSSRNSDRKHFDKIANDDKPFTDFIKYLPSILKPTGAVYLFTRWDVQQPVIDEMNTNGMKVRNVIIWDKCIHSMGDLEKAYGYKYESIVFHSASEFRFQGKRPKDIIVYPRVPADKLVHPNEKPVQLLRKLIHDSTPPNGVVLDCTCGSGTTLCAAILERRQFLGFELDEKFYKIAKQRVDLLKEKYGR